MRKITDAFTLSNGVQIPCVGYGTWKTPDGTVTYEGVKQALQLGYRHIDTAYVYENEASVGQALKDSGIAREEVFITTKQWVNSRGYEATLEACERSLKTLGLDYLDLYLVHWPCVERFKADWKEINAETWRGFEKLYRDGKVRSIGVSNFQIKHLMALKETAEIMPMVDQIEFHPGYLQLEDVRYAQAEGVLVQAWSPLGNGVILDHEVLQEVAKKYNKTTAQVCLRFCLQMGVLPLTKSLKPHRMQDNVQIFDFELSAEDMQRIQTLPLCGFTGLLPEEAPHDIK